MKTPVAALGIDLGGTKIEARLLDAAGHDLWRHRVATPKGDYAATVAAIAQMVRAAGTQVSAFTVGIGTPGVAAAGGVMKNCNSTWLNGRPLQRDVEAALQRPVRIDNDANCLALSEATDGAAAGADVVFAVILGTGTGAGIAVRGHVLHGPNGLAGEWGHNPLPWAVPSQDPVRGCWCGQLGCIETLLSGPAITRDHLDATGETMGPEHLVLAAGDGHAASLATLERHASRLARALAGVINVIDPDVIVLGGGVSKLQHLYKRVPQLWKRWVFAGGVQDEVRTRLVPAKHGDASGVRGAAWLWRGEE